MWGGGTQPEAFSGFSPIPLANDVQIPSGRTWTETPHEAAQIPQENRWKESLEVWAGEGKHRRHQQEEENWEGGGKIPSLLKFLSVGEDYSTCAQKERTWTTIPRCGGKGRFVELYPVKGDKKRPVPLAWWPGMAFLVPSVLMGSNDNHQ